MTTEDDELHPTDGARYLLERDGEDANGARYCASIFTPDERFDYRARLGFDGTAELEPDGAAAPARLERRLQTMAKVLARDAAKKKDDGFPPWPHRQLRWRR